MTIDQVRREIQTQWPKLKTWQAQRIARTETAAMWTTTSINAYAANGVSQFESLIAHGPTIGIDSEAPCDECSMAATMVFTIEDDLPPWHPNCRCEAVPILEDPETGEPWLPPDEPWAGGDMPMDFPEPIPAPAPGEQAFASLYSPSIDQRKFLHQQIDQWKPYYGDVESSPLKAKAHYLVDSAGAAVVYSTDAKGDLTAIGGFYRAANSEARTLMTRMPITTPNETSELTCISQISASIFPPMNTSTSDSPYFR